MFRLIPYVLFMLLSVNAIAQQYKVVYAADDMPELFNVVTLVVEEQKGETYQPLKRGYKLSTDAAILEGNTLILDRAWLHEHGGKVPITLSYKGTDTELELALPILKDIRFNLYADSIKPVLNYYLNIEGEYTNGKIYPLDTNSISLSASEGSIQGMEWVKPKQIDFEKVTFTAVAKHAASLAKDTVVYIKKYKDPADEMD